MQHACIPSGCVSQVKVSVSHTKVREPYEGEVICVPCLPARRSCPRRRHRHPGHPGHHHRRCRCRGRRQGGVGTATGHHQRSRWRPSADEWYHFNGELSRNWMAVPGVLAFTATLAACAAFGRLLAVGFGVLSLRTRRTAFRQRTLSLLTAHLSRSQTPCSSSTSSKASFGLWCALGRLSRST